MNAYAIFAINEHLEFLLEDAAERRAAEARKPHNRSRFSRLMATLGRSIDRAADTAPNLTPALNDYPFKG
jgi:hypothetical protein